MAAVAAPLSFRTSLRGQALASTSARATARVAAPRTSAGLFDFLKGIPKAPKAAAPKKEAAASSSKQYVNPDALLRKDKSLIVNGAKAFGGTNSLLTSLKPPRTFALNPRRNAKASFSDLEE